MNKLEILKLLLKSAEMKTKWYEVEVVSTTYRNYEIEAKSKEKAEEIALDLMDEDWDISKAWKENAEVTSCEEFKKT